MGGSKSFVSGGHPGYPSLQPSDERARLAVFIVCSVVADSLMP